MYPLLDPKYPLIWDHIPLFEGTRRVLDRMLQGGSLGKWRSSGLWDEGKSLPVLFWGLYGFRYPSFRILGFKGLLGFRVYLGVGFISVY